MKEKEDLMEIVNRLLKHQCDYCCWYYEPRGCEKNKNEIKII